MGGKSKKVTTGFRYYMGLHFAICRGPIDRLRSIRVGDRLAWLGNALSSGEIQIDAPTLFGGDKKEGGVQGNADVLMGESDQPVNSYLSSTIGGLMPAFRGIFSLVFKTGTGATTFAGGGGGWSGLFSQLALRVKSGLVTSNTPYLKPWAFELTRIKQGWGSGACWYPETAEIARPGVAAVSEEADAFTSTVAGDVFEYQSAAFSVPADPNTVEVPTSGWASGEGPFGHTALNSGGTAPNYGHTTHWDPDEFFWLRKTVSTNGITEATISGYAENACLVYVDGVYVGGINPTNVQGQNGSFSIPVTLAAGDHEIAALGMNETGSNYDFDNTDLDLSFSGTSTYPDSPDMNPAHIIYQALTDPDLEMGYPTADLDEASFTAAADTFFDEGLGLTLIWNGQQPMRTFIQQVLDHCGAVLYADPFTGKFVLKAIRDDYDPETLDVYDESSILAFENFQRPALGETVNQIIVSYRDQANNKDAATPPAQDLASIQAQGRVISEKREYPGFSHSAIAQRIAMRDLTASSASLATGRLRINRSLWNAAPGSVIKVSWNKLGLSGVIFRILDIKYGTLTDAEIVIEVAEDVFGLPSSSYTAEQPSGWTPPDTTPQPITLQDVTEATYWDIARSLSAADLANVDEDAAFIQTVASSTRSLETGYSIFARIDPAEYEDAVAQDTFLPYATARVAVLRSDTVIAYSDDERFGELESGQRILLGSGRLAEWVALVDLDTDAQTMTVTRGILDTTPQEHAAGTAMWFATESSIGTDPTERATADEVEVSLTAFGGGGETELADATPMTITADQRFYRPYPPGKVRINGEAYPTQIETDALSITWVDRDREQQTASYIDQDTAGIGPEAGTSYNGYVYDDASDALLSSATSLSTAAAWEPTISRGYRLRIELEAVRAGLVSWQRQVRLVDFGSSSRLAEDGVPRAAEDGDFRETEFTPAPDAFNASNPTGGIAAAQYDGSQYVTILKVTDPATGGESVYAYTSPDAYNWTQRSGKLPSNANPSGLLIVGGVYYIMGVGGRFIRTSDLDVDWSFVQITSWPERNVGGGFSFDIIHDGTQFVGVGSHGLVITSADFITWTEAGSASMPAGAALYDLEEFAGYYVAVGSYDNGTDPAYYTSFTSTDLETWTERTLDFDAYNPDGYFGRLSIVNGSLFYLGQKLSSTSSAKPGVAQSTDGLTWTDRDLPTTGNFSKGALSLHYVSATWYLNGQNLYGESSDLINWTLDQNQATPSQTRNMYFQSGGIYHLSITTYGATSNDTELFHSADGITFTPEAAI